MPANLTPDYKKVEAAYKRARDPQERLDLLQVMHRTIPKHKGTEHLRADIKTKIKELKAELTGPSKGGVRTGPATFIHPEGAAQVAILGPPNTGKSALHAALTGSHTQIGSYPFTTQYPEPGMLHIDDAAIQLVDLPPISSQHPIPWIGNTLQSADGALFVVDLGQPGCVEQIVQVREILAEQRVTLVGVWDPGHDPDGDPFAITLPTLLVANKADSIPDIEGDLAVCRELGDLHFPTIAVSAQSGEGLDVIGPWLFRNLEIVRVYTKVPGKEPDRDRPYTVRHGATVDDVARLVHRDLAASFRHARIWGLGSYDGQQVGRDHVVEDGDILEIHA
ncbi:MAG: TGS domain-containing protein [Actinomycetota bacterium]|nr:TGS domain-containing protein [Actinomycetota bacterium]